MVRRKWFWLFVPLVGAIVFSLVLPVHDDFESMVSDGTPTTVREINQQITSNPFVRLTAIAERSMVRTRAWHFNRTKADLQTQLRVIGLSQQGGSSAVAIRDGHVTFANQTDYNDATTGVSAHLIELGKANEKSTPIGRTVGFSTSMQRWSGSSGSPPNSSNYYESPDCTLVLEEPVGPYVWLRKLLRRLHIK